MQRWTAVLVLALPALSLSFGSPPPPPRTPSRATPKAVRTSALCSGGAAADGRDPAPPAPSARASARASDAAAADRETAPAPGLEALLARAQECLRDEDAAGAFAALARAYGIDPTSSKVAALFGACLRLKVELAEGRYDAWKRGLDENESRAGATVVALPEEELNEFFQDRMGLSSLSIDREQYDEAGFQLRKAIEEAAFWLNRALLPSSQYDDASDEKEGGGAARSVDGPREDFSSTRFRHWQPKLDRAHYLLYRTNAGCCHWDTYFADGDRLRRSLLNENADATSPAGELARMLHPFDALKFPCASLALASDVARGYARRALDSAGVVDAVAPSSANGAQDGAVPPRRVVTASRRDPQQQFHRKIRIGYISPDFTARHPLAFLMQHVFRHHDKARFLVNVYSVASSDEEDGPEVRAIRDASDRFAYLSPAALTPLEMYQTMLQDGVDVIVDLCGYAGTSVVAEAMASRCRLRQEQQREGPLRFPVHVSYMGFPGSVGSARVWDYSVFDPVVVPPEARGGYDEALVYMPHCYFVNSHRTVLGEAGGGTRLAQETLRAKYGIHPAAFVYCCHSRPDKIDPSTFKSWMRALLRVQADGASTHPLRHRDAATKGNADAVAPVLWLLRSGDLMEQNLRRWVRQEFGTAAEDCLVFAGVAERQEHLKRIGIADVFLDTPAYNAHTLGCDALYMGVPMISLLRKFEQNDDDAATHSKVDLESAADVDLDFGSEMRSISTEKLASRVGASLLEAVGLEDLIYPDMIHYEDAMVRCALDKEWFDTVRQRLRSFKDSSPLFDTERWVQNMEAAFEKMVGLDLGGENLPDIVVSDDS